MPRASACSRCSAGKALSRLPGSLARKQFTLDEFGDQRRDRLAVVDDGFLRVVLDDDGAVAKFVQLLCVTFGGAIPQIALRKEQLHGPFDLRGQFAHQIDLAFPAGAENADHLILARKHPTGLQVEVLDVDGMAGALRFHSGSGRSRV